MFVRQLDCFLDAIDRKVGHAWREAAAGLSAIAAAMMLLYFSVSAPAQSFDDAVSNSDSITETAAQTDNDLLGQQILSLPAPDNNLAG